MKKDIKKIQKEIQKHAEAIGKHRDALRDLEQQAGELREISELAVQDLEYAVEKLSELV